jgi:predicted PurR-regulated permease PerM
MRPVRNFLFAVTLIGCLAAVTWPVYDWLGNRIEPFVLGLPLSLAWITGVVVLNFVGLLVYHLTGDMTGDAAAGSSAGEPATQNSAQNSAQEG